MKHNSIKQQLDSVRPKLKFIAPLTYRLCQGFAGVNLIIAIYFLFITTNLKNAPLAITQGFLGFTAWGLIYLALSGLFAYGLYKNNWKLLRVSLGLGLTAEMMWTLALVLLVSTGYPIFGIMILWLSMTWTTAWTLVHFLPVIDLNGIGNDK